MKVLAKQNLQHWRWRHITIALLIALNFCISVVFNSSITLDLEERQHQTRSITTAYFDAMLWLVEGQSVPFRGTMFMYADQTGIGRAHSNIGEITLLGMAPVRYGFNLCEDDLHGREVQHDGEIVLPSSIAIEYALDLGDMVEAVVFTELAPRYRDLIVVGIYNAEMDYPPCLISLNDVRELFGLRQPNCLVVVSSIPGATLSQDMASIIRTRNTYYAGAAMIYNELPLELVTNQQHAMKRPSLLLQFMVQLFTGIAVFTMLAMTFMERRKEYATLKSIGMAEKQMLGLAIGEYLVGEISGLIIGWLIILMLSPSLQWSRMLEIASIARMGWLATVSNLLILALAMAFPLLTTIVASVNQLLFTRNIPLIVRRMSDVDRDNVWSRQRQVDEGVRLLVLPENVGKLDCLVLRSIGDRVKQGETLAIQENWGGFYVRQWIAPCDGVIIDLNSGGYLAIKQSI